MKKVATVSVYVTGILHKIFTFRLPRRFLCLGQGPPRDKRHYHLIEFAYIRALTPGLRAPSSGKFHLW